MAKNKGGNATPKAAKGRPMSHKDWSRLPPHRQREVPEPGSLQASAPRG